MFNKIKDLQDLYKKLHLVKAELKALQELQPQPQAQKYLDRFIELKVIKAELEWEIEKNKSHWIG